MAQREPEGMSSAAGRPTASTPEPGRRMKRAPKTQGYTARTWAVALLNRLGAPATRTNIQAIVAWEAAEGGHWNNTAHYNPLNTTENAPGATSMNDVGVKAYTSWQEGLDATVRTLENGNYGHILNALRQGTNANAVAQAVVNSPWGTQQISIGGHANYGTGPGMSGDTVASDNGGVLGQGKPMNVQDYLSQADTQYGYLSAFLHNKEIGPILAKAAKNGWSQDRMLSELEKTRWWKHTSASARSWEALKQTDPATARLQLHQQIQQIQQLSKSTLGYHLDAARANQIANTAIALNWSQAQLQKAIGAEFRYQGAQQKYQGAAGQTITQLQQIAHQYVVPLSPHALQQWSRQILEGTYSTADFEAYVKQQAASMYPTAANALKEGQTTLQFADPYLQVASQVLEKPADQFDLTNPKWNKALLQPQPDGTRNAMTLDDWATYLRSLPEYQNTSQAKNAAADFGLQIGNMFGKVASPYQGHFGDTAINFGST